MKKVIAFQIVSKSLLYSFLFLTLVVASASAADIKVDLLTEEKGKQFNFEAGAVATLTPNANGTGCNISADFTNGGTKGQYWIPMTPFVDGPIAKFVMTAKITGGTLQIGVRDPAKQIVSYTVPAINDTMQTFDIELTKPLQKGEKGIITYPIKYVILFFAKKESEKMEVEIEKLTLVTN